MSLGQGGELGRLAYLSLSCGEFVRSSSSSLSSFMPFSRWRAKSSNTMSSSLMGTQGLGQVQGETPPAPQSCPSLPSEFSLHRHDVTAAQGAPKSPSLANSLCFQSLINTCPMHPKKSQVLQQVQLYQGHWHLPHSWGTIDWQGVAQWVKYTKTSQTYHQPGEHCDDNLPHPQHDPGGLLLQFLLFFGKPCREG